MRRNNFDTCDGVYSLGEEPSAAGCDEGVAVRPGGASEVPTLPGGVPEARATPVADVCQNEAEASVPEGESRLEATAVPAMHMFHPVTEGACDGGPAGRLAVDSEGEAAGTPEMPALLLKTTLCRHYALKRKCPMKEGECKFAHGFDDLDAHSAVCPFDRCAQQLASEAQCEEHMALCHRKRPAVQQPPRSSIACQLCDKACNSAKQLREHLDAHLKRSGSIDCAAIHLIPRETAGAAPKQRPEGGGKAQLCRHFSRLGACRMRGTCKFAHGWDDLDAQVALCPLEGCRCELRNETQYTVHMDHYHRRVR